MQKQILKKIIEFKEVLIAIVFYYFTRHFFSEIFSQLLSDLIFFVIILSILRKRIYFKKEALSVLTVFNYKIHVIFKNKIKILGGIIVLILIIFGFYLYKLHALMVEANDIFAIRCTTVNPPLISYKTSFLNFADYLQHPDKYKEKDVKVFYNGYISGMRKYVKEENKWLTIQDSFIKRWDYQLIEPWYIKKAEDLQWKMYQAYRDDAQYLLDIGDQKIILKDPFSGASEPRDRRDKYSQEYFDFYIKATEIRDWRKFFGYVPFPNVCNEKNTTIPNTSGSIDWNGKSATPSSEFVPIDPYNVI